MKQTLLIVSAMLILFTSACAAALLVPAAIIVEGTAGYQSSQELKIAENTPKSSIEQTGDVAPAHVSGTMKSGIHICGKMIQKNHISGKSFDHVSGGSFY